MGDRSAYESLGLEPGADQAAIDRAYKKLIKEHHPDREGGDSKRAAEINRAYRELRGGRPVGPDALELNDHPRVEHGFGWMIPGLVLAAGASALLFTYTPIGQVLQQLSPAVAQTAPAAATKRRLVDAMDVPLHGAAIEAGVRDARQIAATRDEMGLAAESSRCHGRMRSRPDLKRLDRCVAFDDAVVLIQDRDPLRDRGPFSELAVTGRQWSSASALSSDYLAIDGRLDRIKVQVELALAEGAPEAND
ncbi:MAG: J domain-containing protein [Pseudomonadota bacterium]